VLRSVLRWAEPTGALLGWLVRIENSAHSLSKGRASRCLSSGVLSTASEEDSKDGGQDAWRLFGEAVPMELLVTLVFPPIRVDWWTVVFWGFRQLHDHRQSRILSTLFAELGIERVTSLGSQTLLCHDSALVENPMPRVSRQTIRRPLAESRQVTFVARPTPLLSRQF
jgi:hypothetical protein